MTQSHLFADGETGIVAIYKGPQSDAIEADPMVDLDRVTYHSKLDNIGFYKTTVNISVALSAATPFQRFSVSPFSHGLPYTPVFYAELRNWPDADGSPRPVILGGGTLLDCFGQRPSGAGPYDINLGSLDSLPEEKALIAGAYADDTDVVFWVQHQSVGTNSGYPDTIFEVDFYVGDRSIDGDLGEAQPSDVFLSGTDKEGRYNAVFSSTRVGAGGASPSLFSLEKHYPSIPEPPFGDFPVFRGQAAFLDYAPVPEIYQQHRVVLDWGSGWAYRMCVVNGKQKTPNNGYALQALPDLLSSNILQASI